MTKMSDKLYGHSPKMERDEESGKVAVKKKDKADADTKGETEDQGTGESLPVHARHAIERMDMHHMHQHEHHMHDHGKHGHKKEMHQRHEKMMKELYARHEKEMGSKKE